MQHTIIAIGGIRVAERKSLVINREIIKRSNKKKPHALFIPTASDDRPEYCEGFTAAYKKLGCTVDTLLLVRGNPDAKEIKSKIQHADIVFVGGGNTFRMMRLWEHRGVDRHLRKAHRDGTVLCGSSAGAICWFDGGHSDSWFYYKNRPDKYIRVTGLGLVKGTYCPHFHGEKRVRAFEAMMAKRSDMGIACDNDCAIEISGGKYRILRTNDSSHAYRVFRQNGKGVSVRIKARKEFRPISELMSA